MCVYAWVDVLFKLDEDGWQEASETKEAKINSSHNLKTIERKAKEKQRKKPSDHETIASSLLQRKTRRIRSSLKNENFIYIK